MKTVIAMFVILILATIKSYCYEVPGNPDHYISLGLDYSVNSPDANVHLTNETNGATLDYVVGNDNKAISLNLIVPVNPQLSFALHGTSENDTSHSDVLSLRTETSAKFNTYGVSLKWYIH